MNQDSTITIPGVLADKSLPNFFKGWRWPKTTPRQVTLNLKNTEFLAPWALTLIGAYAVLLKHKKKVVMVELNPRSDSGAYAIQAGLLDLLGLPRPADTGPPDANKRTVSLALIRTSAEIPGFSKRVMDLLAIGDDDIEGAVSYSLVELLRNVVQHSSSPVGGLAMAQYFPKTGLVELMVADVGIGIQASLAGGYPEIDNDFKALKFAMQAHVSGTFVPGAYGSMRDNAGVGLFFIKEITTLSGGGFFLGSGEMLASVWGDKKGQTNQEYHIAQKGGWNGTFALLQLRRDTIGEFAALLQTCRELAAKARKDPSEVSLDFLNEVPDIPDLTVVPVREFEENVEEAARVRDTIVGPKLARGEMVVLDFSGIRFATQSFVHACIYKVLRECRNVSSSLSIANCTASTREAILAVAAYASVGTIGVTEGVAESRALDGISEDDD